MEGFGFAGKNVGATVSADCDREEVSSANAEVNAVFGGGRGYVGGDVIAHWPTSMPM